MKINFNIEDPKFAKRALIIGALLCFSMPAVLTWKKVQWIDFTSTGNIGDTIGGITAPVVGLLGAYLVYVSFRAQIEANRIQASQSNFNTLYNMLRDLKYDYFSLRVKYKHYDIKGLEMFTAVSSVGYGDHVGNDEKMKFHRELLSIYSQSVVIADLLNENKLSEKQEKAIYLTHKVWFDKEISPGLQILLADKKAKLDREPYSFYKDWIKLFE